MIKKYDELSNNQKTTLTIGNFDGVHIGHQQLLSLNLKYKDTKHVAMTFDPHPVSFFKREDIPQIMMVEDKVETLMSLGLDDVWVIKFDENFSKLSVEEFVEFLKKLSVERLVIGRDYRFASKGAGSVEDLKKHFIVDVLDDQLFNDMRISSSLIKDYILNADFENANHLLTRPYMIHGEVVHGSKVGRLLGFPTANIDYKNYVIPKNGVYHTIVHVGDEKFLGITNVGNNPTVNYSHVKRVETYIIGYEGDLYGQNIKIEFKKFLRPEYKFESKEALIEQMYKDKSNVIGLGF